MALGGGTPQGCHDNVFVDLEDLLDGALILERGEAILLKLADELSELAVVESKPNLDGRNMIMMLAPAKGAGESDSPESERTTTAKG